MILENVKYKLNKEQISIICSFNPGNYNMKLFNICKNTPYMLFHKSILKKSEKHYILVDYDIFFDKIIHKIMKKINCKSEETIYEMFNIHCKEIEGIIYRSILIPITNDRKIFNKEIFGNYINYGEVDFYCFLIEKYKKSYYNMDIEYLDHFNKIENAKKKVHTMIINVKNNIEYDEFNEKFPHW